MKNELSYFMSYDASLYHESRYYSSTGHYHFLLFTNKSFAASAFANVIFFH